MSISSHDPLHLCQRHDQIEPPNDLSCFPVDYTTLESASTTGHSEMSFDPEHFSNSSFTSPQGHQLEPGLDNSPFHSPPLDTSIHCSDASGEPPSSPQLTTANPRNFVTSNSAVYESDNVRQSHIAYSPYHLQGYYINAGALSNDPRQYPMPMMFDEYGRMTSFSGSPSSLVHSPASELPPVSWHSPDVRKGDNGSQGAPYLGYYDADEDDFLGDKPYARLIYEALMQAPGHRMMLREIYEWFVRNTTKPKESGTNGWQNSIRHNLSMNQVSRRLDELFESCRANRHRPLKMTNLMLAAATGNLVSPTVYGF